MSPGTRHRGRATFPEWHKSAEARRLVHSFLHVLLARSTVLLLPVLGPLGQATLVPEESPASAKRSAGAAAVQREPLSLQPFVLEQLEDVIFNNLLD